MFQEPMIIVEVVPSVITYSRLPEVLEIAAIKVSKHGDNLGQFEKLIKPKYFEIPDKILYENSITIEELKMADTFYPIMEEFKVFRNNLLLSSWAQSGIMILWLHHILAEQAYFSWKVFDLSTAYSILSGRKVQNLKKEVKETGYIAGKTALDRCKNILALFHELGEQEKESPENFVFSMDEV